MKAQITKEAFRALVPVDTPCTDAETSDDFHRITFHVHGLTVTQVEHFLACCTTYWVMDINA